MLVAQLEVEPAEALVRLRAHAYATGRSATDVAATSSIAGSDWTPTDARATADTTRMEGNVTETPRETRVLDAVVSLVDTLLDDFDVVDLLTELTERCAQLLDVAAAGLPARRPAATGCACWPPPLSRPGNWSCFNYRPTKARASTATTPANRSRSPTCPPTRSAGRGSSPPRSTPASPRCTLSRCARQASCLAR